MKSSIEKKRDERVRRDGGRKAKGLCVFFLLLPIILWQNEWVNEKPRNMVMHLEPLFLPKYLSSLFNSPVKESWQ